MSDLIPTVITVFYRTYVSSKNKRLLKHVVYFMVPHHLIEIVN